MRTRLLRFAAAIAAFLTMIAAPVQATEAGWALLRNGGQIVFLANANAPGTGDPGHFDIENCRTQRNLSDRGRQQARRIGALFAARAEPVERVLASRYCRTLETARLAFGDSLVEPYEPLDVPSQDEEAVAAARQEILDLIADHSDSGNLVLVTHPETILAVVGARAREGEAVIVAPAEAGLHVLARIVFN